MKILLRFLLVLGIISIMVSCRSTKKIQTAITKKDTTVIVKVPEVDLHADSMKFIRDSYTAIENNKIDFNTFSARIKVNFEDKDGKKNDFTAFVRLRKDSVLWVKIDGLLGIEGFRILITPDSVKVLNKPDKVYQLRSVSYLQDITHLPFTFTELQNLILGNPIYLDSNIVSYKKEEKTYSFFIMGDIFRQMLTVNKDNYAMENSKLDDADIGRARTCLVVYGSYEKKDKVNFSTFRKISVSEKNKLDIEMEYKQYGFNEPLSYPFSIPKNYKQQ